MPIERSTSKSLHIPLASAKETPDTSAGAGNPPPGVPETELQQLATHLVQFGGADPSDRETSRKGWTDQLADYLAEGYLEHDTDAIDRRVESARHAEGVEHGAVNLTLADNTRVLGFVDCQGVGDTYYVCRQGAKDLEYYAITIESGTVTGGPYDIYVTDAMDWIAFKDQLPAM